MPAEPGVHILRLPENPISIPDLVGRSFRIARVNWRMLILLFVSLGFLFEFCIYFGSWLCTHEWLPDSYRVAFFFGFWLILMGARWETNTRCFALFLALSGKKDLFTEALNEAHRRRWTVLLISTPIVLLEFCELAITVVYFWLSMQATGLHGSGQIAYAISCLAVYSFIMLMTIPMGCISILNLVLLAVYASEHLPLSKVITRSLSLLMQCSRYVIPAIILEAIVINCLTVPCNIAEVLQMVAGFFNGMTKELVTGAMILLECCLVAPMIAFCCSASALFSLALLQQMTMRLEATDIIARLQNN